MFCSKCGKENSDKGNFCSNCGSMKNNIIKNSDEISSDSEYAIIERIYLYEKISAILWIFIAIFQIISVLAIVAGIWNLIAGISRLGLLKDIKARKKDIPKEYEGVIQLIIIGFINLFLGAGFGIVIVIFDFYIRGLVLDNQKLFTEN